MLSGAKLSESRTFNLLKEVRYNLLILFKGFRGYLSGPVLRDTARLSQRYPPIARYGVFGVLTWPIGCDTPSFSEHFPPLGEHAKWRCDNPPLKRGISAIPARYPKKTRQMRAIPPSAILSRKGIARYGGGISHWAAKGATWKPEISVLIHCDMQHFTIPSGTNLAALFLGDLFVEMLAVTVTALNSRGIIIQSS